MRHAAAMLGAAVTIVERQAVQIFLHLEVDDARNRVRTIDGRGCTRQYLDLVDQPHRDVRNVGEVAAADIGQREIGDAAAVDEHERMVGAKAAQVDLLRAGGEVGAAARLRALRLAAVLRHRREQFGDAGIAVGADRIRIDGRDRRRPLILDRGNARTGDDDLLHRALVRRVLRQRRRGERGKADAQP